VSAESEGSTYDLQPEMSAAAVTNAMMEAILSAGMACWS